MNRPTIHCLFTDKSTGMLIICILGSYIYSASVTAWTRIPFKEEG